MTEEEENGNLLDGFSISGVSKAMGGNTKIIAIIILIAIVFIVIRAVKKNKVKW